MSFYSGLILVCERKVLAAKEKVFAAPPPVMHEIGGDTKEIRPGIRKLHV
jgi:hypothetical protein